MQQITYISVDKLRNHPSNPRKIDETQFKILCKSIEDNIAYFETRPILCNKDYVVFAGNMRLRAARHLKMAEVPVAVMDVSDEKVKELMLRDNKQNGHWDHDLLNSLYDLDELKDLGFSDVELGIVEIPLPEPQLDSEDKEKKLKTCPSCGHEF